jgi:hypothetical protein
MIVLEAEGMLNANPGRVTKRSTTNHLGADVLIYPVKRSSTRFLSKRKFAELCSAGLMRTAGPAWFVVARCSLSYDLLHGCLARAVADSEL